MKKALSILLLIAMLCMVVLSACKPSDNGNDEQDPESINLEEIDPTTPILTIGDEKISFAIYKALYESYLPYMQSTGYDPLASKSSLESFQDWLVDSLAKDLVVLHQADENGFTLTEEQEAELKKQTDDELQERYDEYYSHAQEDYEADPTVDIDTYFLNYINNVSEYYTGVKMNWEEYKAEYAAEARRSYIIQAYKESVSEEFAPTGQDITDWYDTQYNSNKSSYTDYPSKYKTDEEYYEKYFGEKDDAFPILYVPAGYSRVMHIVVSPEGELSEEYNTKMERIDEIKAEFAELAFEDAVAGTDGNADAIAALINEYNGLKAETDAEFAGFTAAANDKISQAYRALQNGQPFAEVMLQYTEDPLVVGDNNYDGCKAFQEKGQLISLEYNSSNDWSEAVKEEFSKLTKGSYSEVFMDGGSYHILYYVGDEEPGDVQLAKVYSAIETLCMENVKTNLWDALTEEWLNDPELVKNMPLIRALGLKEVKEGN